jgi:hypothetical protein
VADPTRTFKEYYADHGPADSIEGLQQLLDAFRWDYNVHRPHQSLSYATPQDTYTATPKAAPLTGPTTPASRCRRARCA